MGNVCESCRTIYCSSPDSTSQLDVIEIGELKLNQQNRLRTGSDYDEYEETAVSSLRSPIRLNDGRVYTGDT